MNLYTHQQEIYDQTRQALIDGHKNIFVQLATGGGKTFIFAHMGKAVHSKQKRIWFIVPRNELIHQASEHLNKLRVPHGMITATSSESRAFSAHVVSKDTLIRRWDKIKAPPDMIVFDEGHLYFEQQKKIIDNINQIIKAKQGEEGNPTRLTAIAFSATPEGLDGRDFSEVYSILLEGKSIPWLTAAGYLTELRYYSPPLIGIEDLKFKGHEADEEDLEELLKRRKVYGDMIGHYKKHGAIKKPSLSFPGQPTVKTNQLYNNLKPGLFFARSVAQAYSMAEQMQAAGIDAHCIEGNMSWGRRKELIDALRDGKIDALTNRDICTYGLDVPRVEYGASLRPTKSKSLYFQIIGRILRNYEAYEMEKVNGVWRENKKKLIYKKEHGTFFDHVNMIKDHEEPGHPGVPPHWAPKVSWNFTGEKKKTELCPQCIHLDVGKGKKDWCKIPPGQFMEKHKKRCKDFKKISTVRLCEFNDYQYCTKTSCSGCPHKPGNTTADPRKEIVNVPVDLVEIPRPKKMHEMPFDERRETQNKISEAIAKQGDQIDEAVADMIALAEKMDHNIMWVYWTLSEKMKAVNFPVLHAIARAKRYKPFWATKKGEMVRQKLDKNEEKGP
jgi:superfamily II DNA or RNA helicase